jgi:acyl carrier protein
MNVRSDLSPRSFPSREHVLAEAKRIVGEALGLDVEKIEDRHLLQEDLGADSLDIVEITMEVEEEFDLTVADDVAEQISTVGDIADAVLRMLRIGE